MVICVRINIHSSRSTIIRISTVIAPSCSVPPWLGGTCPAHDHTLPWPQPPVIRILPIELPDDEPEGWIA